MPFGTTTGTTTGDAVFPDNVTNSVFRPSTSYRRNQAPMFRIGCDIVDTTVDEIREGLLINVAHAMQ
jgi:hypothetical protein